MFKIRLIFCGQPRKSSFLTVSFTSTGQPLVPMRKNLTVGDSSDRGKSTKIPVTGRFIAWQKVVAFVAYVLNRFESEVPNAEQGGTHNAFPRCEEKKPCLGVMRPVHGNDLIVRIRPY